MCSRAQAFARIASGAVTVNGRVAKDPSTWVSLDHDEIVVDGAPTADARETIVIALHKPAGYVTTRSDPQGRKTVYDLLPASDRFLFPVGRLDRDTSGLLLFTDDHRLGEALTNPESHVPKTYEVGLDRAPDAHGIAALRLGLDIGRGERTQPAHVRAIDESGTTMEVRIREGKNRQIRRMFAAVGVKVVTLTRTAIGGFTIGDLPLGRTRPVDALDRARLLERS